MSYLFTSESVSEGHPDKVCDQISDALLDAFLAQDPDSKVACETTVTTGFVNCMGEVKTNGYVAIDDVARGVIEKIGYTKSDYQFDAKSCAVLNMIHGQSVDINRGVERKVKKEQGAGDQGIMFGYACREMDNLMPYTLEISHLILRILAQIRKEGKVMTYLRPDAKSQVTLRYADDGTPEAIETIVVSTQHDEFDSDDDRMLQKIRQDVIDIVMPKVIEACKREDIKALFPKTFTKDNLFVNPTGKFVIGGPCGDTGLTGRKIIVDTYGGHGAHGGGAFSGKDSSKVDRSAAYAARHIAKNLVAAGVCDKALVQLAYAIGVADPVSVYVYTYGTSKVNKTDSEIASVVKELFPLKPYDIIKRFGLKYPIFSPTASYGHFGRDPYKAEVTLLYPDPKKPCKKMVTFFGWEKLDYVEMLKNKFSL